MKPKNLQHVRVVPAVPVLLQRLHAVEAELAACAQELAEADTDTARAAIGAHEAALSRRRDWYVARIRAHRPVEALGVEVADAVALGDGL